MALVMGSLSVAIYEIFTDQTKCQKFNLAHEGQGQKGEKLDFRHSTGNVRFYIDDFFPEF